MEFSGEWTFTHILGYAASELGRRNVGGTIEQLRANVKLAGPRYVAVDHVASDMSSVARLSIIQKRQLELVKTAQYALYSYRSERTKRDEHQSVRWPTDGPARPNTPR